MSNSFGHFKKIEGSDRYYLSYIIKSPYEQESQNVDSMVKTMDSFTGSQFEFTLQDIEEMTDNSSIGLFSFGEDGSIEFNPQITDISFSNGQDIDPVDGVNQVLVQIAGQLRKFNFYERVGGILRQAYPAGYSSGGGG